MVWLLNVPGWLWPEMYVPVSFLADTDGIEKLSDETEARTEPEYPLFFSGTGMSKCCPFPVLRSEDRSLAWQIIRGSVPYSVAME